MKFSLNKKTILLIVCIAVVISLVAIAIYDKGIHDVVDTEFQERAVEIAKLTAVQIDSDRLLKVRDAVLEVYKEADNKVLSDQWGTPEFDEYVSQFAFIEETEDFLILRDELRRMQDVLNVNCLYIIWLDVENECYVYIVDAAYEDACPVGCIDPLFIENAEALTNPDAGLPPNITNTPEYGWIVAAAMPIYGDNGEVIALSTVDISMNDIVTKQYSFLTYVALAFLVITLIVCVAGIFIVDRVIIKPINKLSKAAERYASERKGFSDLKITRGDEIGILANSMARMEEDINGYISNLEKTTKDLISARELAVEMDRAANIDALTKVRNKRAYDVEVKRLNESSEPYGIAMIDLNGLKSINDTYGHDMGDVSIKTVCGIVCRIVKHSPVFRVGGDEFVAIIQSDDYEERDEVIAALKAEFRKNVQDMSVEPWERVTAAVGFAAYDPKVDMGVESVLKRADAAMYENKREIKESL